MAFKYLQITSYLGSDHAVSSVIDVSVDVGVGVGVGVSDGVCVNVHLMFRVRSSHVQCRRGGPRFSKCFSWQGWVSTDLR